MVAAKARFLGGLGQQGVPYPISDQQFAAYTSPVAFDRFLARAPAVTSDDLAATHLSGFADQTLLNRPTLVAAASETSFGDFAHKLFAGHTGRAAVWKELVGEEFVEALLQAGFACWIVVRDPRDMITSQLYGRGRDYVGAPRPLLFLARQWRKSVAYGLAKAGHPQMRLVRFEDLFAGLDAGLGQNSSFGDSPGRPGRYAELMPDCDQAFVEAACYAELRVLGYPTQIALHEVEAILATERITEHSERPDLSGYRLTRARRDEECRRCAALRASSDFDAPGFLFPHAQTVLGREMQAAQATARATPD